MLLSQLDLTLLTFIIRFVTLELPVCSITLSPWSYPYVPSLCHPGVTRIFHHFVTLELPVCSITLSPWSYPYVPSLCHPGVTRMFHHFVSLELPVCSITLSPWSYPYVPSLCLPGVSHMFHFMQTKNLPFSVEEVRQMTTACRVCAEHKHQLHKPVQAHLIKATQPFECLNIDFKGPLKSNNRNSYFLNVIDEYRRFPFLFSCKDISTPTVIRCLSQLLAIFRMPAMSIQTGDPLS